MYVHNCKRNTQFSNTGTSDLPDTGIAMYAQCQRAAGSRVEDICMYVHTYVSGKSQVPTYVTTNMYYFHLVMIVGFGIILLVQV